MRTPSRAIAPATVLVASFLLALGGQVLTAEISATIQDKNADRVTRLIFFAVLEGCYEDGISNADVDLIIPPIRGSIDGMQHFVLSCPLCTPAIDGFHEYRSRPTFYADKKASNTFGPGLQPADSDRLRSPSHAVRREVIQALIGRWVGRRLESMRLTPSERQQWAQDLEDRRKKGQETLAFFRSGQPGFEHLAQTYAGWKDHCAVCDGSTGACPINKEAGTKQGNHQPTP